MQKTPQKTTACPRSLSRDGTHKATKVVNLLFCVILTGYFNAKFNITLYKRKEDGREGTKKYKTQCTISRNC